MKKNNKTKKQRVADAKRGLKRNLRTKAIAKEKAIRRKQFDARRNLIESRYNDYLESLLG
jgi:hypothetical protein